MVDHSVLVETIKDHLKDQFLLQVIQTQERKRKKKKKQWNFNSIASILNFNFDLVLFNRSPRNENA